MEGDRIISESKQPKPLNPEVKDYELLPENEKIDLDRLVRNIIKWTDKFRKNRGVNNLNTISEI